MKTGSFAAALIVGGQSTRMGADKAHFDWHGVPLWRHQLITLEALEPAEVMICCGQRTDFSLPHVRVVPDEIAGRGPIGGIAAALAASNHERVLVLAVDLPEMPAAFLATRLIESTETCGVVGERAGFYEPLAAVYPRRAAALAAEVATDKDHSMQHFVRRAVAAGWLHVRPIEAAEIAFFRNVNSPRD